MADAIKPGLSFLTPYLTLLLCYFFFTVVFNQVYFKIGVFNLISNSSSANKTYHSFCVQHAVADATIAITFPTLFKVMLGTHFG